MPLPARDPDVGPEVRDIAAALERAGHRAWLAGEELARAWWASPGSGPRTVRLLTDAPAARVALQLPRAVVTHQGVLSQPTPDGAIDVLADRALPDALGAFAFRALAVGWDVAGGCAVDPWDGLADVAAGRLRTVGDPVEWFERFPVLALRALRLVAQLGLELDASLEPALGAARFTPTSALRAAGRSEITGVLCGAHAGRALALAAASGLAKNLAPGADPGLSAWIDATPRRPELRLALWLGGSAGPWLRSWRFGLPRSERIVEIAHHHPIETAADSRRDTSVARLLRRLTARDRSDLIAAREAQLASGVLPPEAVRRGRRGLAGLAEAIERVEGNRRRAAVRSALALSGEQVMEQLGCGPGPRVGRALRHLAELCTRDPARNTEADLRAALEQWARSAEEG
jgi:tRNA nucleotidyltransferase/poly(A) polymerase